MISVDAISKSFGGVRALDGVTFDIARGECHGLMGENGAGKSTLGKILAGIHRPDSGTLRVEGVLRTFRSPRDAARCGIGMVHQELAFCPDLSVAENLSLGRYPRRMGAFVARGRMVAEARRRLAEIGVCMDVSAPMRQLSTGQEQLVQIAHAVGAGARLLIFDEPTSSLSEPEAHRLFDLIERLRLRGVTMVYVSHRMPEVFRLCDRITVLRDGRYVDTLRRAVATPGHVVQLMIGRALNEYRPRHLDRQAGAARLRVTGLASPAGFEDVTFEVRAGEVVGLAGLVGSGRSEVAQAVFGLDRRARGRLELDGSPLPLHDARGAMRRGLGLVPEDRKRQGLVPGMSVRGNFSLATLRQLGRFGFLDARREIREARLLFDRLRVRTPSLDTPASDLSGGNQQKVVMARWLGARCGVLLVDEPTRGVDVGAKQEIHALLDELACEGRAILLISSELPELLKLSTRILVFRTGRVVADVPRADATQDLLLRLMAGV